MRIERNAVIVAVIVLTIAIIIILLSLRKSPENYRSHDFGFGRYGGRGGHFKSYPRWGRWSGYQGGWPPYLYGGYNPFMYRQYRPKRCEKVSESYTCTEMERTMRSNDDEKYCCPK